MNLRNRDTTYLQRTKSIFFNLEPPPSPIPLMAIHFPSLHGLTQRTYSLVLIDVSLMIRAF